MNRQAGRLFLGTMIAATVSTLTLLPVHASGHLAPIAEPYEPGNAEVIKNWQFNPGETQHLAYDFTQSKQFKHHHHCRHKDDASSGYKL